MNFVAIDTIKFKFDQYYLIKDVEWSPSGYVIAQYNGTNLICEATGKIVPFKEVEEIVELND
jgi:hypothetical protein